MQHATAYHAPVMVGEVLAHLRPERGGWFLDATLGGGGHAEAVLEAGPEVRLIGVDRDPDALAAAGERLGRFGMRLQLVRANFAAAREAAGIADGTLTGALLDLGISSHQIDDDVRGFTFRRGAPLDMRMARATEGNPTAAELLNELDEHELADIFFHFGEERRSRKLSRIVVSMRQERPFQHSDQLVAAVRRTLGPTTGPSDYARIFQALRIAVNSEIDELQVALPQLRDALAPGGLLAILSYHSLEDRLVKNAFRDWSTACSCPPALPGCVCSGVALGETLTRKPVEASPAEVASNPRARSARLRAWRHA
ncbi:16S rRNA (cytosine(1402)-N(4))-methyltransferase RsmH [soil metagenome]